MALDFALCPTTCSVDWTFLRGEISAWSRQPRQNQPVRWMVLCVFSNWIARIPKVWDGCLVGVSLALLHAAFCAEPGKERAELFQQVIHGVSLQGWPGLVLEVGWPIFELVAAHGSIVQSGGWKGQEELFPVEPPECTKLTRGADDVRWEASLITMDRAQRLVETGQLRLEEPEVVFSLNLLCSSQTAPDFASATACTLKALAAPQAARRNLIAAAERAAIGCLGEGAPGALITALLRSPWPLAHLLGRLRPPSLDEVDTSEKYVLQTEASGLVWQPRQLPYASGVLTFEQTKDAAFPWVQFVARAVPAERILMELPWPDGVSFEEIQREAIALLSQFPTTNYPGPSNDRETWKTLCLVCKDGLQDPASTSEGTVYAKTEIFSLAPALERFVDLFGKTGRVRLSVVLPGGMIAWHPDARVVENGRLILHVPIRSQPGALTRLGQILFHAPEGVLHWADYSLPHSVFNAGAEPRVHLIVDVASRNNEDFERNFLRRWSPEVLEHFVANAMPPVDAMATEASAVGPPGSSFVRPLSRQMSDAYTTLVGGSTEMLALERRVWQQVGEAYATQVAQMMR